MYIDLKDFRRYKYLQQKFNDMLCLKKKKKKIDDPGLLGMAMLFCSDQELQNPKYFYPSDISIIKFVR